MIGTSDLKRCLLDLLKEIENTDFPLIIGGGFGIYLKMTDISKNTTRTVLQKYPEPRSTNDLDLFLRAEILADSDSLALFKKALDTLGYKPVETAKYYQFSKSLFDDTSEASLKIDLLTGNSASFKDTQVVIKSNRAKPRPSQDIHAHITEEAFSLLDNLYNIKIKGKTSAGTNYNSSIYLPHPFTYAIMKLFAFRDRVNDPDKDFGSYHALDLYSIIACCTEKEWEQVTEMNKNYEDSPQLETARSIIKDNFSTDKSLGIQRLKSSPYFRNELQIKEFIDRLNQIFTI